MFNKIVDWLVFSSTNPDEYSATLKGFLLQYSGYILFGFQAIGIPLSQSQYVTDVAVTAQLFGFALMTFGLLRKMYFLIKPTTKTVPTDPTLLG